MKELKGYYRQIKGWLPCGGKVKRTLMANITATIEGYIAENPGIDFPALQAHFGTPQQIASAFVDEMGTEELLNKLRVRRKLTNIALCFAGAIVVIWGIFMLILCIAGVIDTFATTIELPPVYIT